MSKNSFDSDYSKVIDVLAATFIFKSESDLLNALRIQYTVLKILELAGK